VEEGRGDEGAAASLARVSLKASLGPVSVIVRWLTSAVGGFITASPLDHERFLCCARSGLPDVQTAMENP